MTLTFLGHPAMPLMPLLACAVALMFLCTAGAFSNRAGPRPG
jgi:hypothetical protein